MITTNNGAQGYIQALEALRSNDVAPNESVSRTITSPNSGGLMAQLDAMEREILERTYFSDEDVARVVGTTPPEPEPVEPEPTREEVIETHYPEFIRMEHRVPRVAEQIIVNGEEVIPTNSDSLLITEETSRFSSAIWYEKIREQNIILAGAGGIGSYVGFLLSRMHPSRITIYDNDIVEEGNLSGQFYEENDIGRKKVNALCDMMAKYSRYYKYIGINELFTNTSTRGNIMICGFDNMTSRKIFYAKWKAHVYRLPEGERKNCLYIDGRLAAEEFQVLCIQGNNTVHMEKFEREWLFSDEEAEATQCSYKQTSFCANMIASVMVNLFVNFIANKCEPLVDRAIPFFTYYDASQMFFKEEF